MSDNEVLIAVAPIIGLGVCLIFAVLGIVDSEKRLDAARDVILEFVYPDSAMTPQQREVWEKWQEVNK